MRLDSLGNPVSTDSDATLAAVSDFVEGFLAYERRAENIVAAADRDADCCLANAYAGILWMLLEAPDAAQRAAKYLAASERAAATATRREQMNVAVLRAWVDDRIPAATGICTQIADEFPHDLAVVKLHQYFDFNRGNFPGLLRSALQVREANDSNPYIHGMAAFGYEQCHLLEQAHASAHQALALRREEPWAQHALAHVYLTRGMIDEGARFLESVAPTWTQLNSFMYTHNWWHLALFYLSQGRFSDVFDIYDRHCWGIVKTYSQDQIGAVSLLARIELAGVDVGDRWRDLGDYLVARAQDTVQPFLTMQYLYGLARAARPEADQLMQAVRVRAVSAPEFIRETWNEVALPACEGMLAHARGDFAIARRRLSAALPRIIETGGSHAQRDLFEQILLDSCLHSGALLLAQQQLEMRRAVEPNNIPINTKLAVLYGALGLPGESQRARSRVTDKLHAR